MLAYPVAPWGPKWYSDVNLRIAARGTLNEMIDLFVDGTASVVGREAAVITTDCGQMFVGGEIIRTSHDATRRAAKNHTGLHSVPNEDPNGA